MFSADQRLTIFVCAVVSSSLSFVGSVFVFTKAWRMRKVHSNHIVEDESFAVQALINLLLSLAFSLGPYATDGKPTSSSNLCVAQAFFIQLFGLMSALWTLYIGFTIHAWVVLRRSKTQLLLYKRIILPLATAIPLIFALFLLQKSGYGHTGMWCWVTSPSYQFPFYWVEIVSAWFLCFYMFVRVVQETRKRVCANNATAADVRVLVITERLSLYLVIFVVGWVFGLINRTAALINGGPLFVTSVLHALVVPLQGALNALAYSTLTGSRLPGSRVVNHAAVWMLGLQAERLLQGESMLIEEVGVEATLSPVKIFVTSWNMAECDAPRNMDQLFTPAGEDVDMVVFGVQECLDYTGVEKKVKHLFRDFQMYATKIGAKNTMLGYHGYIAMICLVRKTALQSGVIEYIDIVGGAAKRGLNYGLGRAANKGAIGFGFRILGAQVAFIGTHMAADTGGKNGYEKRNADARSILRELSLEYDHAEFDTHLTHHHTIFLGDMNYRIESDSAEPVLQEIAEAFLNPEETALKLRRLLEERDQLTKAKREGMAFTGFTEMPIFFPPTYRYKKNVKHVDLASIDSLREAYSTRSKKDNRPRIPSYTDRILWNSMVDHAHNLTCEEYGSVTNVTSSDHRAVHAVFKFKPDLTAPFFTNGIEKRNVTTQRAQYVVLELFDLTLTGIDLECGPPGCPIPASALNLIFPIPSEDPFYSQRKLNQVFREDNSTSTFLTNNIFPFQPYSGAHPISMACVVPNAVKSLHLLIEVQSANPKDPWAHSQGVLAVSALLDRARNAQNAETEIGCPFEEYLGIGGRNYVLLRGQAILRVE